MRQLSVDHPALWCIFNLCCWILNWLIATFLARINMLNNSTMRFAMDSQSNKKLLVYFLVFLQPSILNFHNTVLYCNNYIIWKGKTRFSVFIASMALCTFSYVHLFGVWLSNYNFSTILSHSSDGGLMLNNYIYWTFLIA